MGVIPHILGHWSNLTPELITNLYLYGETTTPADYEERLRSTAEYQDTITVKLDMQAMMESGPGRYASAPQAQFVQDFFENGTIQHPNGSGALVGSHTKAELVDLGFSEDLFRFDFKQMFLDTGNSDYIYRTYIFNSQLFTLSDDTEFHFSGSTNTNYITDLEVRIFNEDFDFESSEGITGFLVNSANVLLEEIIDPHDIGRTVDIEYSGTGSTFTGNYTLANYNTEKTAFESIDFTEQVSPYIDPYGYVIGGGQLLGGMLSLTDSMRTAGIFDNAHYGSNFSDNLIFENDTDEIPAVVAGGGNDVIEFDYFDPTGTVVYGGEGNDKILSKGNNDIDGGDGEDTVSYENVLYVNGVTSNLTTGLTTLNTAVDTLFNVEHVTGSNQEDEITGNGFDNFLSGQNSIDELHGSGGNDTLVGGADNDYLYGGDNSDTYLIGTSDGEDTIEDGHGADRIFLDLDSGTTVSSVNVVGLYESLLKGTAVENTSTIYGDWEYSLKYGSASQYTAYLNWDGNTTIAGARADLEIDFDATGIVDLTIENFANGEFGITLEDVAVDPDPEEGEFNINDTDDDGNTGGDTGEGGGDGAHGDGINVFFTTPGSGNPVYWSPRTFTDDSGLSVGYRTNNNPENYVSTSNGGTTGDLISSGSDGSSIHGYSRGGGNGNHPHPIGILDTPPVVLTYPAISAGDPHLLTFDGSFYDFQDSGEYTLVKSTDSEHAFTIQARQEAWDLGDSDGELFSVNTAIATQLGNTRVGFYTRGSLEFDLTTSGLDAFEYTNELPVLWVEEEAYFMPPNSVMLVEDGIIIRDGYSDNYTVVNAYGDNFTVNIHENHINLGAGVSSLRESGSVEGLLGNCDGDSSNDFILDDGTPLGSSISNATLYNVFGEDWRIEQSESLFLYGNGQDTNSFDNPNFDSNAIKTLADFDPADVAAAETAAAAEGFDPNSDIFDAVVLDFLVMGYVEYDDIWAALEQESITQADITGLDILYGTELDDLLYGTNEADFIMAMEGNDSVYGQGGDDTLVGGLGDDIIYTGSGNDLFIHHQGDGNDTYVSSTFNSNHAIEMYGTDGQLLEASELRFMVGGYQNRDLIVINRESGESVTLINMYYGAGKTFASVNGIVIKEGLNFVGTDAAESISATPYNDTLEGGLGNDTLNGGAGADLLIHRHGDGNDVFKFSEYNSSDHVEMYGADGLLLEASALEFIVSGYQNRDLIVTSRESGESVTLENMYYGTGRAFENVNGITVNDGLNFVGTDIADSLTGSKYSDTLEGGLGDDTLDGGLGADLFIHRQGDGNDLIKFSEFNSSDHVEMYGADEQLLDASELEFIVSGYQNRDLIVTSRESGESVTLENMYYGTGRTFESVNGITVNDGLNFVGTDAAESINGTQYDDTLEGGIGDDTLDGGLGADLFIHRQGDGNDLIKFSEFNSSDHVEMYGADEQLLDASELGFAQSGYDLVVTNLNSNETLTLGNMYYSTGNTFDLVNGIDLSTVL
ncbi:VWD domain-containing protein [Teredinibacter turnerae]|uniref:VWD domain-containing protein n=1 Tax=Teredinibacter turnerae TaxID=2426 RepID=UPI0003A4C8AD|nr:VWD domain-containing protein [Teredinibacter turnerae]